MTAITIHNHLRDQLLHAEIVDGLLCISIGVDTLTKAVTGMLDDRGYEGPVVVDSDEFAEAILMSLQREEEDGSTVIHHALDKAAINAVEDGCEGITFGDD